MFKGSRRFLVTGMATLAFVALAAGLAMWVVVGSGTASADSDEQHNIIHGDFAFGFDGATSTSISVSENGKGKNKSTTIGYDGGPGNFGFGNIPNGDFSSGLARKNLKTDTSRITGGTVVGATGPINVTFVGNGGGTKTTGTERFGFLSNMEVKNSGMTHEESATVSGTIVGATISDPVGSIGKTRINQKVTHVSP